jgi:hypothetical protein
LVCVVIAVLRQPSQARHIAPVSSEQEHVLAFPGQRNYSLGSSPLVGVDRITDVRLNIGLTGSHFVLSRDDENLGIPYETI